MQGEDIDEETQGKGLRNYDKYRKGTEVSTLMEKIGGGKGLIILRVRKRLSKEADFKLNPKNLS